MNLKELRRLMPENAQDSTTARQLVLLDQNVLMPIVPDMLSRLKDHDSPVVDIYCEFFAQHGEKFSAPVGNFLARTSTPQTRNIIVTRILVHWTYDTLVPLIGTMQMLVTHTDFFNTDLVLIKLLHSYSLADQKWLSDWLEFKRNRLALLTEEANQVALLLAVPKDSP